MIRMPEDGAPPRLYRNVIITGVCICRDGPLGRLPAVESIGCPNLARWERGHPDKIIRGHDRPVSTFAEFNVNTEVLSASNPNALRYAVDVLRYGGLVAFPTDTVYGVGALAFHREAVQRLYTVKGRPTDKAIAVLVGRPADLGAVAAELSPAAQKLMAKFWPGSLTLVVPKHPSLPEQISALPTVGVRMPDHDLARSLLELTGPMAVTSANRSGELSALTANGALEQLAGRIELILDGGRVPGGVPSTVVDVAAAEPVILREGPVSAADIEAALAQPA
jgi:L-threonylcarbamoyladenylate synthase